MKPKVAQPWVLHIFTRKSQGGLRDYLFAIKVGIRLDYAWKGNAHACQNELDFKRFFLTSCFFVSIWVCFVCQAFTNT